MRAAGTIAEQRLARRFADYLLTLGIAARLGRSREGWTVWVFEEDAVGSVRSELEDFVREPAASRYAVSRDAERIRAEAKAARIRRLERELAELRGGATRLPATPTPLVWALLVFCGVVALATNFGCPTSPRVALMALTEPSWATVVEQPWRLVTPIFVHAGLLHLLFVATLLLTLGRRIEAARGTGTLAALVFGLGILGNVVQVMAFKTACVGLSAAAVGLFGYAAVTARLTRRTRVRVREPEVLVLTAWIGGCLLGLVGPAAHAAHAAGLAGGLIAGAAQAWLRRRRRR